MISHSHHFIDMLFALRCILRNLIDYLTQNVVTGHTQVPMHIPLYTDLLKLKKIVEENSMTSVLKQCENKLLM